MLQDNLDSNLSFSDLLRGRLISQSKDMSLSNIELQQMQYIFEDHFKLSTQFDFQKVKNISLVDRNFAWDSLKFDYDGLSYLFKLGDEEDNYIFSKEFKRLKKLEKDFQLAPKPILNGVGPDYAFLITSYEYGNPIKDLGQSELLSRLNQFASCLRLLHTNKSESSDFELFLEYYFTQGSFQEILNEELYNTLTKTKYFKKCQSILKELTTTIKLQVKNLVDSDISICHMNLTESNILVRGQMMKFINFDKSLALNPLWDLAMASIKLDLVSYPKLESKFLMCYDKFNYDYNCEALPAYKDIASKMILHDLICSYFFKIIIKIDRNSVYNLYKQYETIRHLIHNEFPSFLEVLDEMFGDFQKQL